MKARVKTTGEIVDIAYTYKTVGTNPTSKCETLKGKRYNEEDLDFNIEDDNTPDYWTRLEHQYAGMAMQGMSEKYLKDYRDYCAGFGDMDKDEAKATMKDFADAMADVCYYFAHALVQKLKEKEERK